MEDVRRTLVHRLEHWAQTTPDAPAIHEKKPDGTWHTRTWAQYWQEVRDTAKGLIALGHQVGDCVGLLAGSRCGWVISQFATQSARGIPAPIYPNNTTEQAAYIIGNSRSNIAIAGNQEQLDKYLEAIDKGMMKCEHLICMDEPSKKDPRVRSMTALQELGRQQDDSELNKRLTELTDDETSMLIYTSGTTGVPKGVQLSQGNIVAMADGLLGRFSAYKGEVPFRIVSYLPLCHVAEQIATNFAQLGSGGEVYFCADITQIKDHLTEVRPTVFLGVPRVWEKFQNVLEGRFAEASGIKASLAQWARKTELAAFKRQAEDGIPQNSLMRTIANKLVVSKVKDALGLDQLHAAFTGAAPISEGTLEFFASLGISIYEVYGMSETTGICSSSEDGKPRFGTVGRAMPGVEVKLADDDEILVKGPICTCGYLHMPEETKELFTTDGWLQTGDLGKLDDKGYLKIVGRKKDILITAGGKNVAPAEMEGHINQITGVGQVIVIGDKKPYLTALVTLDIEALDALARDAGVSSGTLEELAKNDEVKKYLMDRVESDCNAKVARYQTIKKIKVLPLEFSVEGGELTPTMKAKRNVVVKKYAADIKSLYA
ncbi:MAG: long-chain fatty acid--CoA ligase [Proteobacteria bacterium]|nr:long-chain fatty acid--CoA ligase [Pseudomonadota bacterium]